MPDIVPSSNVPAKIALGCAAVLLGFFAMAGIGVVVLAAVSGGKDSGTGILIGLVFIAIPAAGLLLVAWAWRLVGRQQRREAAAPGQPWAWKEDFTSGVVRGQGRSPAVLWGVFAGIWVGFMTLVTVVGRDQIGKEPALIAFLALFWAAGAFLSTMAVRAVLRARRFGESTAAFDAVPARLGGWLSGVIHAPVAVQGAQIQITVDCEHRSSTGRHSTNITMWRATKLIDGTRLARQAGHVEIPFAVKLPTNAEAAAEVNRGVISQLFAMGERDLVGPTMTWYVRVSGRVPGVDYDDVFTAPVAAQDGTPVSPYPPRPVPELAGQALEERLPARVEHNLDADVFVFPLKASFVAWPLGCAALAIGAVAFRDLPALATLPPPAFKWTAIASGALAALSLVGLLFDTRRIEVRAGEVRIRRGALGLGIHRTIPRQDIEAVVEETSRSEPPTYQVNIRLRSGKTYWAAPTSSEADRAAAVAARLRQVLQLGEQPPAGGARY